MKKPSGKIFSKIDNGDTQKKMHRNSKYKELIKVTVVDFMQKQE